MRSDTELLAASARPYPYCDAEQQCRGDYFAKDRSVHDNRVRRDRGERVVIEATKPKCRVDTDQRETHKPRTPPI